MSKPAKISGFNEFLPPERAIEKLVLREIHSTFATYGFLDIEHRSVEPISALLAKGETSKEVYLLNRLQEAYDGDGTVNLREKLDSPKQLGLHFDLTVPFARYVLENAGKLQFPFRRSSIGKVWRGERPQAGRFREFTQADVDIINQVQNSGGNSSETADLPLHNDVEIVRTIISALTKLEQFGVPQAIIHVNSRHLLQGCYEYFGVADYATALQIIDKLPKIGDEKVAELLTEAGFSAEISAKCLEIAQISTTNIADVAENSLISAAVNNNKLARLGLDELQYIANAFSNITGIRFDLSITRGLDYYTGLVFETFLDGFANYGSIASGGRYDDLASTLDDTSKVKYPGVGMSIGVSRLLSIVLSNDLIQPEILTTTAKQSDIMVICNAEETRNASENACEILRNNGIRSFVCPNSAKFGKQIDFAAKRNIDYVLFIDENDQYQIKNIVNGTQEAIADLTKWKP